MYVMFVVAADSTIIDIAIVVLRHRLPADNQLNRRAPNKTPICPAWGAGSLILGAPVIDIYNFQRGAIRARYFLPLRRLAKIAIQYLGYHILPDFLIVAVKPGNFDHCRLCIVCRQDAHGGGGVVIPHEGDNLFHVTIPAVYRLRLKPYHFRRFFFAGTLQHGNGKPLLIVR